MNNNNNNNYKFPIGSTVWFKGDVYVVISAALGVRGLERSGGTVTMIPISSLEKVAIQELPVGTRVRSSHTFVGEVTGYELATNRLITVSDKKSSESGYDRRRYAYKLSELKKIVSFASLPKAETVDNSPKIKLRTHYKITTTDGSKYMVQFLEGPQKGLVTMSTVGASREVLAVMYADNILGQLPDLGVTTLFQA